MRLASIQISNFKGLRSETFEPSRFSCLVGENNAGKSTVLQAIVAGLKRPPQLDAELYYDQAQPIEFRISSTSVKRIWRGLRKSTRPRSTSWLLTVGWC